MQLSIGWRGWVVTKGRSYQCNIIHDRTHWSFCWYPRTDLNFHRELSSIAHRTRRNVFMDMIEDFTEDDDDDGSEEEDESTSRSVESTTTRFGRFISPLAFSKISETLGFYCIWNLFSFLKCYQRKSTVSDSALCSAQWLLLIHIWHNLIALRNSIFYCKLIQLIVLHPRRALKLRDDDKFSPTLLRCTEHRRPLHCEYDARTRSFYYQ